MATSIKWFVPIGVVLVLIAAAGMWMVGSSSAASPMGDECTPANVQVNWHIGSGGESLAALTHLEWYDAFGHHDTEPPNITTTRAGDSWTIVTTDGEWRTDGETVGLPVGDDGTTYVDSGGFDYTHGRPPGYPCTTRFWFSGDFVGHGDHSILSGDSLYDNPGVTWSGGSVWGLFNQMHFDGCSQDSGSRYAAIVSSLNVYGHYFHYDACVNATPTPSVTPTSSDTPTVPYVPLTSTPPFSGSGGGGGLFPGSTGTVTPYVYSTPAFETATPFVVTPGATDSYNPTLPPLTWPEWTPGAPGNTCGSPDNPCLVITPFIAPTPTIEVPQPVGLGYSQTDRQVLGVAGIASVEMTSYDFGCPLNWNIKTTGPVRICLEYIYLHNLELWGAVMPEWPFYGILGLFALALIVRR